MVEYKSMQLPILSELSFVRWEGIQENDDAQAWEGVAMKMTVEVSGDAAGVEIRGTLFGDEWFLLNDSEQLPLNFSLPGIKSSRDMFTRIKPKKTGPGVATVAMLIRRN